MLRQNLWYKVVALLLAVSLWFYVAVAQRRALETQAFTVPVELRHLSTRLAASVDPARVRLFLRGSPQALESLLPPPTAYVSASGAKPGEQTVEVRYVVAQDVRVVRIVPYKVKLTVEAIVAKAMPIQTNLVGTPPSGYILGEPLVAPATATVSGVRSAVARVRHVQVNVDSSHIRINRSQMSPLRAVDDEGAPVEGVEVEPARARVTIPVERMLSYHAVPVVLRIQGSPAPGYRVARAVVSPELVTIAGEAQRLDKIPSVATAPVDVDGADSDIQRRGVALSLPQGIISVSDSTVSVTIAIVADTGAR